MVVMAVEHAQAVPTVQLAWSPMARLARVVPAVYWLETTGMQAQVGLEALEHTAVVAVVAGAAVAVTTAPILPVLVAVVVAQVDAGLRLRHRAAAVAAEALVS